MSNDAEFLVRVIGALIIRLGGEVVLTANEIDEAMSLSVTEPERDCLRLAAERIDE